MILPAHVEAPDMQMPTEFRIFDAVADGRFQIVQTLQSSSQANVYQAVDWEHEDDVALKVFCERDAEATKLVDRELAAHILLDGLEGIVPSRDIGALEHEGTTYRYIATEFAEGGTFFERSKKSNHSIEMAIEMAAAIVPAVDLMHRNGLIHCDIKPKNILAAGEDSGWELSDFGIVETIGEPKLPEEAISHLGALAIWEPEDSTSKVRGTIGYTAPERIMYGHANGPEADIFSMGATLFYAATGKMPFRTSHPEEYAYSVLNESPASVREYRRSVPLRFDMLTRECLSRQPEDRPTTGELLVALQEV